jgi:hypothetical protein
VRLHEVIDATDLSHIVETIKQHCGPYIEILKQNNGDCLFRGSNSGKAYPGHINLIKPRLDRTPLDTPRLIHKFLNQEFQTKFHFPLRNGIFATGNQPRAAGYGSVSVVFPVGELNFIWSPNIEDLFAVVDTTIANLGDGTAFDPDEDRLDSTLPASDYNNKLLLDKLNQYINTYTNKDLLAATASDHEIMFANDCYMVSIYDYGKVVQELIK